MHRIFGDVALAKFDEGRKGEKQAFRLHGGSIGRDVNSVAAPVLVSHVWDRRVATAPPGCTGSARLGSFARAYL